MASSRTLRVPRIFGAIVFLLVGLTNAVSLGFPLLPLYSVSRILELSKPKASTAGSPVIARAATATAQVINGFVVTIVVTDGGAGYTEAPIVEILGIGAGAKATAQISGGVVTNISVIDAGAGYNSVPQVLVLPPSTSGYLSIRTSHVRLDAHVVLGRKYLLETSDDQTAWTSALPPFIAESELMPLFVPTETARRYFRIHETE